MKKNFKNRQIREREREISNIPKGIVIKTKSSTNFNFPDRFEDLDEIINKVSNIDNNQDKQKLLEFEFFNGGTNQKFDSFVRKFGLSSENLEFLDFLQWDYYKEILENNDLQIHIETVNIYYKN